MNALCGNDNLVIYDIEMFLKKYTRFMTKNIYIDRSLYNNFLKSYDYLYKILEKEVFLYSENPMYKKMLEIKNNADKLLKLHNQKYLKKSVVKYKDFFDGIKLDNELELNQKYVVLSMEEKMLVVSDKNIDSVIVAKIKYLNQFSNVGLNNILILTDDDKNLGELIKRNDLNGVDLFKVDDYLNNIINDKMIISDDNKFIILKKYIINDLFKCKDLFNEFCNVFSDYIDINNISNDYEDFNEYYNCFYKRKFLSSKLSLDRFVDKEIKIRKKFLKTIKNESVNLIEEVNVGNYLCLNSVYYVYEKEESIFYIGENKHKFRLKVVDKSNSECIKNSYDENIVYINLELVKKGIYKDILDEEINIRKIKRNSLEHKVLYDILRDSSIGDCFNDFISNHLIKYLDYYDENKNFNNTKLSLKQINVLEEFYKCYEDILKKNNFITLHSAISLVEKFVSRSNYKYVIVNSEFKFNFYGKVLKFISDYKEVFLIRENIKLLYDYKRFLQENKFLVATNCYIDDYEITGLTNSFLRKNVDIINKFFIDNDKKVSVICYDEFKNNKDVIKICYESIRNYNKSVLISINNDSDINKMLCGEYFRLISNSSFILNDKCIIDCEKILNIKKSYNKIILPFLVSNYYGQVLEKDNIYNIKLMLYVSLSKCRDELVILCPKSKINEFSKIIKKVNNVCIF